MNSKRNFFSINLHPLTLFSWGLMLCYIYLFWKNLEGRWFSPNWVSDDAFQQWFPLHRVLDPELFQNDLITNQMLHYLPPLHYLIASGLTILTENVVQASHAMMAVQLALTLCFLYFAVRNYAGSVAACFSLIWFLHTRAVLQRIAGGLPRGWSFVLVSGWIYCLSAKREKCLLALLAAGTLLNPPVAFLLSLAYGLFIAMELIEKDARLEAIQKMRRLALVSPILAALAWSVVRSGPELGPMVTLSESYGIPELLENGRFPYVPFQPVLTDLHLNIFKPFLNQWHNPGDLVQKFLPPVICLSFVLLMLSAILKGREIIPKSLVALGLAAFALYLAARELAFLLYVPNRHLFIPFDFVVIVGFTVGMWRFWRNEGTANDLSLSKSYRSYLALGFLAIVISYTAGASLLGNMYLNRSVAEDRALFSYIKSELPKDAIIAGHPTRLDSIPLLAARKIWVSTETAHPFYKNYREEMRRRLDKAFRIYFAEDLFKFTSELQGTSITHVIFYKEDFLPSNLKNASYHSPFRELVKQLAETPHHAFDQLSILSPNPGASGPIVYQDERTLVVDIRKM